MKITPESFIELESVNSPEIFENEYIFSLKKVDESKNTYSSTLVYGEIGSDKFKILTNEHNASNLQWNYNGSFIGFLSAKSGKNQLYVMNIKGGAPIALTSFINGVKSFKFSISSNDVLVTALLNEEELNEINNPIKESNTFITNPSEFKAQRASEEIKKELETDPRVIKQAYSRAGVSYFNERFSQPFLFTNFERIFNPFDDKVEKRYVGEFGFHYSLGTVFSEKKKLYLMRQKDPALERKSELVEIEYLDQIESRVLTEIYGWVSSLDYVPALNALSIGSVLREEEIVYDNSQIGLFHLASQKFELVGLELDRNKDQLRWIGSTVYFRSDTDGRIIIQKLNLQTKEMTTVVDEKANINYFSVSKNGFIVYESTTSQDYSNLYLFNEKESGKPEKLTNLNNQFLEDHQIARVEEIEVERDGINIQSWIMIPPDHDGESELKVVLEVHGGPSAMWSPHEKTMWHEWNCLTSQGYAIVFCNPRGSGGYGIEYRKAVWKNWGDLPGQDIMKALDTALEKYPFLDKNSIGVTGGSYGGYQTVWLTTSQFSDRFKAAVTQRGVYEFTSFSQTTDIPLWFEQQYDHELIDEDRNGLYHRDSPLFAIKNLNCPLLILHAENDFRVPIVNAEQLFYVAKRYTNQVVEFVRYPREGHELSRSGEPRHIIDRLTRIVNWFNQFIL